MFINRFNWDFSQNDKRHVYAVFFKQTLTPVRQTITKSGYLEEFYNSTVQPYYSITLKLLYWDLSQLKSSLVIGQN